jgi:drug/metabolite transporter (DMT)-like permease
MNRGLVYSIATTIMFGMGSVSYKIFYSMGFNSISISFYTALLSVVALFSQKLITDKNLKFLKISKKDFLLSFVNSGICGLFIINFSIIISLQYVPIGVQQLITNSSSIIVISVYALFMHKKPKKQDIVSCLLILIGLYFVVGKIAFSQNKNIIVGLIFCFLSMFSVAFYSTVLTENPTEYDDVAFWMYAFLGYLAALTIKILLANEFKTIIFPKNINDTLFVLTLIYFTCTLSYITYKKGMVALGPVKHLIITAFSPVISVVFGYLLFKENISLSQLFGGGLILLSTIVPNFIKE